MRLVMLLKSKVLIIQAKLSLFLELPLMLEILLTARVPLKVDTGITKKSEVESSDD